MNPIDVDMTLEQVREALSRGEWKHAVALVESLKPPDQADLFGELPSADQDKLLPRLGIEDSADILEELEDEDAAEIAARLEPGELAQILDQMEPDEAADLLGDIAPERAAEALAAMEGPEEIRPLLVHPDESAGGLMTSVKVVLHREMTAEAAIAYLRAVAPESEDVYYLFVVDEELRLVGVVSLRQLVVVPPWTRVGAVMDTDIIQVRADADQEEAARLMARYDLLALPVVDSGDHLLGLITYDDLVDVLEDEATEDIFRLGGVLEEHPPDMPIPAVLRTRLPWLALNLGTAMVSSAVLLSFNSLIAKVAGLATFFPIVAGVCGSAGTQTLTVTVRGLSLGEIDPRDGLRALLREMLIGLANGVAIGGLAALIGLALSAIPTLGINVPPMLGVVAGLAVLLNMLAAGIAGAIVPILMKLVQIDPALASPILVTTITDACGNLFYLSLVMLFLI
jgi:magnesium transporter